MTTDRARQHRLSIITVRLADERATHATNGNGQSAGELRKEEMSRVRQTNVPGSDPALNRAMITLTACFWLGSYILNSVRGEVLGMPDDVASYSLRLLLNALGAVICLVGQRLILRLGRPRIHYRIALVTAFALSAAVVYALLNSTVSLAVLDDKAQSRLAAFVLSLNYWAWFFLAWAGMLLGVIYSHEAIDRERQLSDARLASHLAQIKALRYQVNPHFLFNTLNAIASLVPHQTDAERLILDLSAFFRVTLSIDPIADIRLERECEIQTLYLNIEKVRYGDRLLPIITLDDQARGALVPSLILQPLVENAVKHGVASTPRRVHIEVLARITDKGSLLIVVRDDGASVTRPAPGTGVGLENVAQRLQSRFGQGARLDAGHRESGGFEVRIEIDRPDYGA